MNSQADENSNIADSSTIGHALRRGHSDGDVFFHSLDDGYSTLRPLDNGPHRSESLNALRNADSPTTPDTIDNTSHPSAQHLMALERKRRLTSSEQDVGRRRPFGTSFTATDAPAHFTNADNTGLTSQLGTREHPIDLGSSPPTLTYSSPTLPAGSGAGESTRSANNSHQYTLPRWQPDNEVSFCPICGDQFSFFNRKHHCRKCGRVVCGDCSPHRITIPRQFIVHPPYLDHHPDVIDLTNEEEHQSIIMHRHHRRSSSFMRPELGGGAEVRLCNPCVPDPNNAPPRHYPRNIPDTIEPQPSFSNNRIGPFMTSGSPLDAPSTQPSLSNNRIGRLMTSGLPLDAPSRSSHGHSTSNAPRSGPFATTSSNPHRWSSNHSTHHNPLGTVGDVLEDYFRQRRSTPEETSFSQHDMTEDENIFSPPPRTRSHRFRAMHSFSQNSNRVPGEQQYRASLARPYQPFEPSTPLYFGDVINTSSSSRHYDDTPLLPPPSFQVHYRSMLDISTPPASSVKSLIPEEDECPVCHNALPPKGLSGDETARETHIMDCINAHSIGNRSTAQTGGGNNAAGSLQTRGTRERPISIDSGHDVSPPSRMLVYHATEKDCATLQGTKQECIICLEEFEAGQEIGRLECLCKFHRTCIRAWWDQKGVGACPTHQKIL